MLGYPGLCFYNFYYGDYIIYRISFNKKKAYIFEKFDEFHEIKEKMKIDFPENEVTVVYTSDIYKSIKIIKRYWKKYRWNYRRNLAAIKYHPSKITFEID